MTKEQIKFFIDNGETIFDEIGQRLESLGQEIELMKKFAKNNSSLFSTLNLDVFNPDIINSIGENSLEKIVRYTDVQYSIIELAKDKDALTTFGFALENLKQDNLFIEPLIEQLSNSIRREEISVYNSEKKSLKLNLVNFLN